MRFTRSEKTMSLVTKILIGITLSLITMLTIVSYYAVNKAKQVAVLKDSLRQANDTIKKMRDDQAKASKELAENRSKIAGLEAAKEKALSELDELQRSKPDVKKFLDQRVPPDVVNILFDSNKNSLRQTTNTRKFAGTKPRAKKTSRKYKRLRISAILQNSNYRTQEM